MKFCRNAILQETQMIPSINQFLKKKWSRRGSLPNLSILSGCMNFCQSLFGFCGHSPDSLSSDMVDLSHVLTHLIVLNDLSTVEVVAGRVSSVIIAWGMAGESSIFFTKSTNSNSSWFSEFRPRKIFFLVMSYQDMASCSKLSKL